MSNKPTDYKIKGRTLWSSPSTNLSGKFNTDDLGTLELPWNTSHDIDGVGTTDTTSNHTQTTGVRRVRVRSDHQSTGECVVLEDNLMNDARAGFPESHIVLDARPCQERARANAYMVGVTFAVEVPKKS